MIYRSLLFVFSLFVLAALTASADTIIIRGHDKPLEGTVKSEDAKSVVVTVKENKKSVDHTIASADVIDIFHEAIKPVGLTQKGTGEYRIAQDAEKEADTEDAVKRAKALTVAITNYSAALKKMTKDTTAQKYAARNVEFKVAYLMVRNASDQLGMDQAVLSLQKFKANFPDSWQIHQVMPMIAQLQMDSRDFKEAMKTFEEMANMTGLPADVRRSASLRVVEVAVRSGDIKLANEKLNDLEKQAGADPILAARVKMARAEVLVGQKDFDKAIPLLQAVLKTTGDKTASDKQTKALAHNTLGECLYKAGKDQQTAGKDQEATAKYQEALWEFLWVDAVFNQDKTQHAKALFYLWKTFDQLNNQTRALQCRELLISDRQFTGTEWQREAMKAK